MTYSSFWYSNESTPLPPANLDIGNSLRFRGGDTTATSAYLSNSSITCPQTFTYSAWIKTSNRLGTVDYSYATLFNQNDDAGTGIGPNLWLTVGSGANNPGTFQYYVTADNATRFSPEGAFIDSSAWYQVVFTASSQGNFLYVNGQKFTEQSALGQINGTSGAFNIGNGFTNQGNIPATDMYLSDVYFIDGQVLTPTAFGKYDDNNKWIPIEYEGTYGDNGFHLTFQPDSITLNETGTSITVADMSGLGNNFTGTGFDLVQITAPPGRYSSGLTVVGGWQAAGIAGATEAFNGLERPGANSINIGADATWAPVPPVTFEESCEVLATDQDWSYNGNNGSMGSTFTYYSIATGPGEISTTTPFLFGNGTTATNMQAVKIDGVVLAEGEGTDYDLMIDSPTRNFATLNPSIPSSSTLADGNLQTNTPDVWSASVGTIPVSSGTWVWARRLAEALLGWEAMLLAQT